MPIIKNKIFVYLVTRYITYGLQFLLSLIIAARLGPYYLGVYGVVQLIINYFEQINFGIPHSLNVLLVHNKNSREKQDQFTLNSMAIYTYINLLSLLVVCALLIKGGVTWGDYIIDKYLLLIVLIAMCSYYNSILTMVVRFRNKVNILSIVGTIPVILSLIVVFFFGGERLVYALFVTTLISYLIVLLIFCSVGAIPKLSFSGISRECQKTIIKKGLYLFLYNSCFYFILIGVRTIISQNYAIEEYGYFTFSFTIANAVMLLLSSINTIIFPKTIDILSGNDVAEQKNVLNKLRVGYITTANLLVFFALICFPLVTMLFTKYSPALTSMNLIALAVLMNTNSYGYITLLIAQNKEKLTSRLSFSAFLLSMIIGCILVYVFHVEFSYVILSVMGGYMLFAFLGYYFGNKLLFGSASLKKAFLHFFPLKFCVPYLIAVALSIMQIEYLIWIPFVVCVIMNYNDLKFLKELIIKLKNNPNIIDI